MAQDVKLSYQSLNPFISIRLLGSCGGQEPPRAETAFLLTDLWASAKGREGQLVATGGEGVLRLSLFLLRAALFSLVVDELGAASL